MNNNEITMENDVELKLNITDDLFDGVEELKLIHRFDLLRRQYIADRDKLRSNYVDKFKSILTELDNLND